MRRRNKSDLERSAPLLLQPPIRCPLQIAMHSALSRPLLSNQPTMRSLRVMRCTSIMLGSSTSCRESCADLRQFARTYLRAVRQTKPNPRNLPANHRKKRVAGLSDRRAGDHLQFQNLHRQSLSKHFLELLCAHRIPGSGRVLCM